MIIPRHLLDKALVELENLLANEDATVRLGAANVVLEQEIQDRLCEAAERGAMCQDEDEDEDDGDWGNLGAGNN